MPKRSSLARAYSRHSERTSQARQTFLASRVDPPFSGKKDSGSVWAHSARSCQPSSSSASSTSSCCTVSVMCAPRLSLASP
ncbi:hypothetical protein SFUMM280S_00390 [Streptomyces fumanus]